ncbi:hypothetical protein Scep_012365 [Stephania cephalantha]|uniref:Uncharacterized protein n=1 Tax=Stephania cephalantha TaxID=152367 RepID=A0AAP0JFF7_9MAGN
MQVVEELSREVGITWQYPIVKSLDDICGVQLSRLQKGLVVECWSLGASLDPMGERNH